MLLGRSRDRRGSLHGFGSPTGAALMYFEDSIRIELAGGVVERAA
jgi:hypothetical protein